MGPMGPGLGPLGARGGPGLGGAMGGLGGPCVPGDVNLEVKEKKEKGIMVSKKNDVIVNKKKNLVHISKSKEDDGMGMEMPMPPMGAGGMRRKSFRSGNTAKWVATTTKSFGELLDDDDEATSFSGQLKLAIFVVAF